MARNKKTIFMKIGTHPMERVASIQNPEVGERIIVTRSNGKKLEVFVEKIDTEIGLVTVSL